MATTRRRGHPRAPSVPCGPMDYQYQFVMGPTEAVRINEVVYPPIVLKVILPNEMYGCPVLAQPVCLNADNQILNLLDGAFVHQGIPVDDGMDYTPSVGSTSSSLGKGGSGFHAVYFVFANFSFTSTGEYKIRLKLEGIDGRGTFFLGDVETGHFDIGQVGMTPQVPGKSTYLSVDSLFFLRGRMLMRVDACR